MKILKDEKVNLSASYLGVILTVLCIAAAVYSGLNVISGVQYSGYSEIASNVYSYWAVAGVVSFSIISLIFFFNSFIIVSPNEKVVVSFLGKYRGTINDEGVSLVNPFFSFEKISTKISTFETQETKINDREGIPLNVSMVVNYRVEMAAPYHYNAEKPAEIILNTSESELRKIVTQHVFDSDDENEETLSKNLENFSKELVNNINNKIHDIGVVIISANITKISYAPEIAHSMLQRQQAKKVGESRKEIVKAAVSTVMDAINDLEREVNVKFDEKDKKDLLKNLMLVIVSEKSTTPVIHLD